MISIVLGQYHEEKLAYKGHVTMGVVGEDFRAIKNLPKLQRPPFDEPFPAGQGNGNAVWTEPKLVCVVEYMHKTKNGSMRQPVFKGLRRDKLATDCRESKPRVKRVVCISPERA